MPALERHPLNQMTVVGAKAYIQFEKHLDLSSRAKSLFIVLDSWFVFVGSD